MPRRRYNPMSQTFERMAVNRAGNRQQAPTANGAIVQMLRREAYNRKRRKSNGGNGG